MERWKDLYQQKRKTAGQIADMVGSGWVMGMDTGVSQAPGIMAAVADRVRRGEIADISVHAMNEVYPLPYYEDEDLRGKMTGTSWFSAKPSRDAVNGGYGEFIPSYYRDMPSIMRRQYDFDAYVAEVSPMDRHGYFSLACVSSYSEAMIDKASHIFVEVNRHQPRAVCGTQIHISQIDALTEYDHELPVLPPVRLDEASVAIGERIAEYVPDGACLQLGIGAIPDAVGMALRDKHDLGIHTEMFTDSMAMLLECGAVNNSRKQIHRGRTVATFAYGSKRVYDYIHDNPAITFLPSDYVNDPGVIAKNDNVISVNAAIEVDLLGQVCAESVGTRHISGTGGQVDYVRGALQSKGGKSFIAFTSTAKNGTKSRIRPELTPGAVVSTSRNDVDYIVTEYGAAYLRGRSIRERAQALIAIAHPDFRDELAFAAKERHLL